MFWNNRPVRRMDRLTRVVRSARAVVESMEARLLLAGLPQLDAGTLIPGDGGALLIDPPGFPAPCVADWNADGKKDLIVGQYDGGKVKVFLNQGTDAASVFDTGSLVLSDGTAVTMPYS